MHYHYVYKFECSVTNEFYYGVHSTANLNDGYSGSGVKWREHLQKCSASHSKFIVKYCEDRASALLLERFIVDRQMLQNPFCLNEILGGGTGDWTVHNKDPENRKYRVKGAIAANKTPAKRKRSSEVMSGLAKALHEAGKIRAPDWTGRKHREETKQKIGLANALKQAAEGNSQFGTRWICNPETKEVKKIKSDELMLHIALGWKEGRK